MTVGIGDGPLGLEGRHIWIPGDGPSFTFNDLESGLPRAKLKKITGLHDTANADNIKANNTAQAGVQGYPSYERDKTITYEGRLQAADQPLLAAYRNLLRGSARERTKYGTMLFEPHPDYGDVVWAATCRSLGVTIDDAIPFTRMDNLPTDYQRDFVFSVEMHDPRYFLWSEEQVYEDMAMGYTLDVTNRGLADTDPIFTINVVGNPPSVTLFNSAVETSNGTARLRLVPPWGSTLPDGIWTVDFSRGRRVIKVGDDASYGRYLDSDYSQWWDELIPGIKSGLNHLQVVGGTGTWSVRFRDRT